VNVFHHIIPCFWFLFLSKFIEVAESAPFLTIVEACQHHQFAFIVLKLEALAFDIVLKVPHEQH
jgi:hypothetical protein